MESLRCELIAEGSNITVSQVHMPAMNTPQFGWCRAKTDTHPMPVPPIYQPERCADAVMRVIEGGRRQKIYGVWNWMLVKLNQVMPGVGDHYMGRTGIDSQLTDMPIDAIGPTAWNTRSTTIATSAHAASSTIRPAGCSRGTSSRRCPPRSPAPDAPAPPGSQRSSASAHVADTRLR
jgi:hypothetical protein